MLSQPRREVPIRDSVPRPGALLLAKPLEFLNDPPIPVASSLLIWRRTISREPGAAPTHWGGASIALREMILKLLKSAA